VPVVPPVTAAALLEGMWHAEAAYVPSCLPGRETCVLSRL
jgi:hypothetical protein